MKKLIVFTLVTVFGTTMMFASDTYGKTPESDLRDEIVALLNAPQFDLEKEEILAEVQFTLNAKNEIVVLSVDSENVQIDTYVKNELNYRKLENSNYKKGKVYTMPLKIMKSRA